MDLKEEERKGTVNIDALKEFGCKGKKRNKNLELRREIMGIQCTQDTWETLCAPVFCFLNPDCWFGL